MTDAAAVAGPGMRPAAAGPGPVLVIKLGALGDVVLALGPLAAIRRHHPGAHLVLLTTPPYAELVRRSGLVDEVWTDSRPAWWQPGALLALRRRLRDGRFARIYDLQTNDRTAVYFRLLGPGRRPQWSGTVRGCSHPHGNPRRRAMHAFDRLSEQLAAAGVEAVREPDLAFMTAQTDRFALPDRFLLMVPGCSPHRPEKRWPAESYASLGDRAVRRGLTLVLLGTAAEVETTAAIAARCRAARDLTGQTDLFEIAALARLAAGAVGNDTGPMHIIGPVGCPCLALFSAASDPNRNAPLGRDVGVMQAARLEDLSVDAVDAALRLR